MLNENVEQRRLELQQEIEDCRQSLDEDELLVMRYAKYIDRDKARLVEAQQALKNYDDEQQRKF